MSSSDIILYHYTSKIFKVMNNLSRIFIYIKKEYEKDLFTAMYSIWEIELL